MNMIHRVLPKTMSSFMKCYDTLRDAQDVYKHFYTIYHLADLSLETGRTNLVSRCSTSSSSEVHYRLKRDTS